MGSHLEEQVGAAGRERIGAGQDDVDDGLEHDAEVLWDPRRREALLHRSLTVHARVCECVRKRASVCVRACARVRVRMRASACEADGQTGIRTPSHTCSAIAM